MAIVKSWRSLPPVFRACRSSLLPLDDCLYATADNSSSHAFVLAPLPATPRVSRLPEVAGDKPAKQPFKRYPVGYFHIDIAEVRTEEGRLYLFVAVDRTSKLAFARLVKKATGAAANFPG